MFSFDYNTFYSLIKLILLIILVITNIEYVEVRYNSLNDKSKTVARRIAIRKYRTIK